ncbi:MAG: hypothetical protein ACO2PP_12085 [Thermocrinis sp.]|uniref:hypothetical protein n=1 Tax=Thermocrinis sp. TaxID=2024383 RepID=UPI003C00371D
MYRKNGHLACKNRAKWVGGFGRVVFGANSKTPKNLIKCLIFNGLVFWSSLWSGFGVALEWLWSVRQILDFQRFANIKQVLVSQRFKHA